MNVKEKKYLSERLDKIDELVDKIDLELGARSEFSVTKELEDVKQLISEMEDLLGL